MPSNIYLTISPHWLIKNYADKLSDNNIKLNIFISDEIEITPALFELLSIIKTEYFISISFLLLKKEQNLNDVLSKIYLLLIQNPKHRKSLPIINTTNNGEYKNLIKKIEQFLLNQGMKDFKLPMLDYAADKITKQNNDYGFILLDELSLAPLNNLEDFTNNYQFPIIAFNDFSKAETHLNTIVPLIITTNKTNQLKFDKEFNFVKREEFETEQLLWKNRTLLYQDFLSLSKRVQEQEYYEVINWYNNEYEILPLWFKRLGHLLKVTMGKRKFRSLFKKSLKKI